MARSSKAQRGWMYLMGIGSFLILVFEDLPHPWEDRSPPRCLITDIGVHLVANDLNDRGEVVGMAKAVTSTRAFLWTPEHGLNVLDSGGDSGSVANSINSSGLIAGQRGRSTASRAAFLWNDDGLENELASVLGPESMAFDVNTQGQVVGHIQGSDDLTQLAFLYDPGSGMKQLGTLGGKSSQAVQISEAGNVIGWSKLPGNSSSHGFIWTQENGMEDLGTLGGANSYANGQNEKGQIVGQSETSASQFHAFRYDRGDLQDLGTLGGNWSLAFSINEAGMVVGQADPPFKVHHTFRKKGWNLLVKFLDLKPLGDEMNAFVWSDGQMVNLNSLLGGNSEWDVLVAATSINNKGQIAGFGLKDGLTHSFLLTLQEEGPGFASDRMKVASLETTCWLP